jgi:hypothetical protein
MSALSERIRGAALQPDFLLLPFIDFRKASLDHNASGSDRKALP